MGFLERCKAFMVYLCALISLPFTFDNQYLAQQPIFGASENRLGNAPKFPAPNGPDSAAPFVCRYPEMKGWSPCSTNGNRGCWLSHSDGRSYSINTDYESEWPTGVIREYYLEAGKKNITGDGVTNPEGKVFNQQYPGPWIQACWGDTIKVTVRNNLTYNGTTVHWHGFRQLGTPEMDGVNGVTQCPIATNQNYTYTFRATQYGTSWYHSHYSLQYADGLHGPITVYGPSSADYDEGRDPIIITDWSHRSAFQDWQRELVPKPDFPKMNSVLINGIGNFAGAFSEKKYKMTVEKGKKYLLRIINTSVDTTYIFSIDNHNFTVMTTDFVPIKPYNVSHIAVGIGQRYHVVLNAVPIDNGGLSPTGDYWIRTIAADGCQGFEVGNAPDERQGILRYDVSSEAVPTTFRDNFTTACRDEAPTNLYPIVPWKIDYVNLSSQTPFEIGKDGRKNRPEDKDNFFWWAFGQDPLWLNFSDPTLINLGNKAWNKDYVVISEDTTPNAWIYMIITAPAAIPPTKTPADRSFFPVAHPMHLHGHDFAILAQGENFTDLRKAKLQFDNPPRRDVALLPSGGYLFIAFKADNPGSWLFHCHIPWHASSGLALQILERQPALRKMMTPERLKETNRVCAEWDDWFANKTNHWNSTGPFQDDSGI